MSQEQLLIPDEEMTNIAEQAAQAAASYARLLRAHPTPTTRVQLVGSDPDQEATAISVPSEVIGLLIRILDHLSDGDAVAVVPHHAELTTQQAADMLGVSRPYFIEKVLEAERIPFRRVGNRRKIRVKDLIAYRDEDYRRRRQVADELTTLNQEIGSYSE